MSDSQLLTLLCTAKFRNQSAPSARGSQILVLERDASACRVAARSPEFAAEIDTQQFLKVGDWLVVLHHQAHKSRGVPRRGVEVFPYDALFRSREEGELLARRLPLPEEDRIEFAASLAYEPQTDRLAVAINGREFRGRVFLYSGLAEGRPRLVREIDLHAAGHLRPAGMTFFRSLLWVASYSGNDIAIFDCSADDPRPVARIGASAQNLPEGLRAPIGLWSGDDAVYVTTHLGHELIRISGSPDEAWNFEILSRAEEPLNHPWGITGRRSGTSTELIVANLNPDDAARSYLSLCRESPDGSLSWERMPLAPADDLFGFSTIR